MGIESSFRIYRKEALRRSGGTDGAGCGSVRHLSESLKSTSEALHLITHPSFLDELFCMSSHLLWTPKSIEVIGNLLRVLSEGLEHGSVVVSVDGGQIRNSDGEGCKRG